MLRTPHRSILFTTVLAPCLLVSWALAAPPKTPGTGTRSAPQPPGGPSKPPSEATGRGSVKGGGGAQQTKGIINGYSPATESSGDDDTLVGTLRIQPYDKGAKLLTLRVHKNADYKIGVNRLDTDSAVELLWKGLSVTVISEPETSTDPKKKAPANQKALKSLIIDTFEVEGSIQEIANDYIQVSVKPLGGKDWPDAEPVKSSGPTTAKPVRPRALKLKTLDRITKYYDRDQHPVEPGEFSGGQKIHALTAIGKGKADGILCWIKPPVEIKDFVKAPPKPVITSPKSGPKQTGG